MAGRTFLGLVEAQRVRALAQHDEGGGCLGDVGEIGGEVYDVNWAGNMLKVVEGMREKRLMLGDGGLKMDRLGQWLKRQMRAYDARRHDASDVNWRCW